MPRKKKSPRVLVIDDSAVVAKTIVSVLASDGYDCRSAQSGEEGLKQLTRWLPDAIFCDIVMPGMDGYEFCRRVKARARTKNVPVILLTSRSDPRDKVRGLDAGAADYVTKPFDQGELKARLAAHLRIVFLQEELRSRNRLLTLMRQELEQRVHELSVLEAKRKKALDLAYRVQLGLLPSTDPSIEGFSFGSRFVPAENIAGDFYDYIALDGGRWGIAIGDVAGKGLPASLLMVLTKTLLRTEALRGLPPGEVLENVNRLVINHYGSAEAVTLFYGILDPATNSFTFSNGGHEFPLLVAPDRGDCTELSAGGPFLGIFPEARYNEARVYLGDRDMLLFYTDGLYHVQVREKPITDEETLQRVLREHLGLGPEDLVTRLLSVPSAGWGDDVTLIAMGCGKETSVSEVGYLSIHGSETSLKDVRDFAATMGRRLRLPTDEAYNLVYAVDEAASNAVAYAYGPGAPGTIQVVFRRDRNERLLCAEVIDHGQGSDADALQRHREGLSEDPLRPRGRGLVLMDNLMDTCDIIPTPGGGTTVRMTKKLKA